MPTRRDQLLAELQRRSASFSPRQQAVMAELQKRGVFGGDAPEPQQVQTLEPVKQSEQPGQTPESVRTLALGEIDKLTQKFGRTPSSKRQAAILEAAHQMESGTEVIDPNSQLLQLYQRAEAEPGTGAFTNFVRAAKTGASDITAGAIGLVDPAAGEFAKASRSRAIGGVDTERFSGKAGTAVGQLIPILSVGLATGGTGGALIAGGTSGGASRGDTFLRRLQSQDISTQQEIAAAVGNAAAEFIGEKIGLDTILKPLGGANPIAAIIKAVGVNAGEEVVTQILQNAVQRLTGIEPDKGIFEGIKEAAELGALGGGIAKTAVTTAQSALSASKGVRPSSILERVRNRREALAALARGAEETTVSLDSTQAAASQAEANADRILDVTDTTEVLATAPPTAQAVAQPTIQEALAQQGDAQAQQEAQQQPVQQAAVSIAAQVERASVEPPQTIREKSFSFAKKASQTLKQLLGPLAKTKATVQTIGEHVRARGPQFSLLADTIDQTPQWIKVREIEFVGNRNEKGASYANSSNGSIGWIFFGKETTKNSLVHELGHHILDGLPKPVQNKWRQITKDMRLSTLYRTASLKSGTFKSSVNRVITAYEAGTKGEAAAQELFAIAFAQHNGAIEVELYPLPTVIVQAMDQILTSSDANTATNRLTSLFDAGFSSEIVQEQVQAQTVEGSEDFQRLLGNQEESTAQEGVVINKPVEVEGEPVTDTIARAAQERSPEGTLSARHVDVDASREAMNNVLLNRDDIRTWEEAQSQAQEQGIPEKAMQISREIVVVPRALSDVETAGVVQRVMGIINEHNALSNKFIGATEVESRLLDAELQRLEQDHAELTQALSISGTEKGRALNSQKLMLNQQFDLVTLINKAKRFQGKNKDVSPSTRKKLAKLAADIKRLEARLANLKKKGEGKTPLLRRVRDQQVQKLNFQKNQLQGRVNRVLDNQRPRTIAEMVVREPLSIMRAIRSSFDVSAVGRQAGLASIANPRRAIKNMGPMFKALVSEKAQFEVSERIKNHPKFQGALRAGLRLTDTSEGAALSEKEENYRSRFADHIPGVRASDRAFSTFLNLMRMDGFDALTETLARNGQATIEEQVAIADTVNNFTGFGGLADMKKSSKILNTLFWSPSLQLARFQILVTRPAQVLTGRATQTIDGRTSKNQLSPRVRKLIAKEYGKSLLGLTTLLTLGLLAGFEIEEDPKSSDFLKLKQGDTRIDIGAGITQFVVLGRRLQSGETKSPISKKIRPISGEEVGFGQDDAFDIFANFARSKFTPGLGLAIDLLAGKNVVGEVPTDAKGVAEALPTIDVEWAEGTKNVLVSSLTPLVIGEIIESFREQEVPEAVILSALSILGVGVQNFGDPKKSKKINR